jgi:hypothetical protein
MFIPDPDPGSRGQKSTGSAKLPVPIYVLPVMHVVYFLLMVRCVELVHEEMQRIIQHCGNEVQQEMLRLIALKSERLHCTVYSVHPSVNRFLS